MLIIKFDYQSVFKKNIGSLLHLKSDSFAVESQVHFHTDYNLLWDSVRKYLDAIRKHIKIYLELNKNNNLVKLLISKISFDYLLNLHYV